MAILDIPLIGSEERKSWLTCCTEFNAAGSAELLFDGSTSTAHNVTYQEYPSEANPWWWQIDFQEAKPLKTWIVGKFSGYPMPKDCKIFGSASGAFAGEDVELVTFTNLPETSGPQVPQYLQIPTPQSFRYFRLVVTAYQPATSWIYHSGFSFEFMPGELVFNTTDEYIGPDYKLGDANWQYSRRKFSADAVTRFKEVVSMFVEDLRWDVEVLDYPSVILVKTNGINQDQPWGFVKVVISGDRLYFTDRYAYWNSETKTGDLPLSRTVYNYADQRESIYYSSHGISVWGNRDVLIFGSADYKLDAYYKGFFIMGHVPRNQSLRPAHTKLTSDVNQAYNATLIVDNSSEFEQGEYYQLWGVNGEGRDYGVQVTSIIDSTHLTVDNLPRNYAAGAFIGTYPQTFFAFSSTCYTFGQRSKSGLAEGGGILNFIAMVYSYGDPSGPQNRHVLLPVSWVEGEGTNPGTVGHTSQHILTGAGDAFDIYLIGSKKPKDKGECSSSTDNSVTDNTADWSIDEHAGRYVYISEGVGYQAIGNFFKIISNTSDTLVIDGAWITNPGVEDVYYIANEIWQKSAMGSELIMKCGA